MPTLVPFRDEDDAQTLYLDTDPVMVEAMAALRDSTLEPENTSRLEIDVTRSWRLENGIKSRAFWIPVLIGAVASIIAFLTLYQLLFAFGPDSTPAQKSHELRTSFGDTGVVPEK